MKIKFLNRNAITKVVIEPIKKKIITNTIKDLILDFLNRFGLQQMVFILKHHIRAPKKYWKNISFVIMVYLRKRVLKSP